MSDAHRGTPTPSARRPTLIPSLREYIDALRAIGEAVDVTPEVDWNLEIGAIIRRCYEIGAPAPLFNHITGIGNGFRVFGAPAGISSQPGLYLSRVALSLGLDARATGQQIVEALVEAKTRQPRPPRRVATGPCKEHVLQGDEVDLLQLPTPLIHAGDGGRYIGTWATIVARTPDGAWTNWSIARVMLVDERRMTGIVHPLQHLGQIHGMWKALGKPMPFAMFQGGPPFIPFVSGMPLPAGVGEADYMGGYFGEPVDVVRCETVELDVPATAEIVVEGYLSDTETAMEGPMGEYAGYLWRGNGSPKPVYRVTAMTYRDRAILPVVAAGEPVEEDHTAQGIPSAAQVLTELRSAGIPATMAWVTLESAQHWLVVTLPRDCRSRLGRTANQICREIGSILFERSKYGHNNIPKVLVMNDDVDPTNTLEVVWALATRHHPGSSGEVLFGEEFAGMVAFLRTSEKFTGKTTKVVYNCLPPEDWGDTLPGRSSFAHNYPASLQDRVLARWQEYGFPDRAR
ncbi:MAG TPA: UbiD family decarboxylase [Gemmatimonadaceae bacterium]|nr:UbiD family decarboxylase [Gemmatimonadaceae bacterium]